MRFDKSLFLYAPVSSMAALGISNTALAQNADEEVVVIGIRGALSQALDIKRDANAIVDAVNSEDKGSGGEIRGFEFQYQQAFENGFGVVSNITLAQSEGYIEIKDSGGTVVGSTKNDLPGASDVSDNVTGHYENNIFAARLAYTYRDSFIAESTTLGGTTKFDEQAFLDGSFTWHVTGQFDLGIEMINMLNEVSFTRHTTSVMTNQVSTDNGKRTYLKASFRMQ